jgi:hypothetical protein
MTSRRFSSYAETERNARCRRAWHWFLWQHNTEPEFLSYFRERTGLYRAVIRARSQGRIALLEFEASPHQFPQFPPQKARIEPDGTRRLTTVRIYERRPRSRLLAAAWDLVGKQTGSQPDELRHELTARGPERFTASLGGRRFRLELARDGHLIHMGG